MLRADVVVIAMSDDDSPIPRIVYDYGTDGDRRSLEQRFASAWKSALDGDRVVASRGDSTVVLTAPLPGENAPIGVMSVIADDIESPERLAAARRLPRLACHPAVGRSRVESVRSRTPRAVTEAARSARSRRAWHTSSAIQYSESRPPRSSFASGRAKIR